MTRARKEKTKMSIKAKIVEGNAIEKDEFVSEEDKQLINNKKEYAKEVKEKTNIGWVISRLDEPKTIDYDGQSIRVSPRSKLKVLDHTKLGELPSGLVLKKK